MVWNSIGLLGTKFPIQNVPIQNVPIQNVPIQNVPIQNVLVHVQKKKKRICAKLRNISPRCLFSWCDYCLIVDSRYTLF